MVGALILEKRTKFRYRSDIQRHLVIYVYCKYTYVPVYWTLYVFIYLLTSRALWTYRYVFWAVCWIILEYTRLKSSRISIVEERVSKLGAAIVLLVFPQMPALIYFGYFQKISFPVERVLSQWMLTLITIELILAISLVRKLIKTKTLLFYRACRERSLKSRTMWDAREMAS